MKVISIGTDRKIFEEGSSVRQRNIEYGKFFEEVHIIVFSKRNSKYSNSKYQVSENVWAYPTNSVNALSYICDILRISRWVIHNSKFTAKDSVISAGDPFETGMAGALIKLFFNLPLHVQVHTDLMHKYFRQSSFLNKARFFVSEFVLRYADMVRVVSERVGQSINSFSQNIDVLPIKAEIDTKFGEEIKKPFPFILIMVCRLEKEKNIEAVLNAIKILDNNDIGMMIVGDGSQKKYLENMAHDMGISERIIFAGWQNDLAPYYKMADAFVSSSLYEGYGISTVEAAFFGKPLVLSETGIAGDVFREGESAFICDAKDPACFAKSILKIYEDKNLAQKMGQSAKVAADYHLNSAGNYFEEYANSIKKTADNFKNRGFIARVFNFKKTAFNSFIALRYFICGITSAAINILSLYAFTDVASIWYLYSSVLSFLLSLVISFVLQKFVVFRDMKTGKMHHQFSKFFIAAVLGVITNTAIVFVCVDMLDIWYIISQIIAGFFVMIQNFVFYKFFIFNKSE